MEFDFPLGQRMCADGITRPVFVAPDGRQFILADDGKPLFGIWLDKEQDDDTDEPVPIVKAPRK
jgi:hypothetical protein